MGLNLKNQAKVGKITKNSNETAIGTRFGIHPYFALSSINPQQSQKYFLFSIKYKKSSINY